MVYKGAVVGTITCIDTNNYHPDDSSYPENYYYASADFDGDVTVSSGSIDGSSVLYFYYIGNRTYTTSGSNVTIDLSDQRGRLSVISYACSAEAFTGSGPYTIYNGHNGEGHHWLLNQCALVKFECENIYDMSANTNDNNPYAIYKTTKDITIYGMDNQVTIDLANTTIYNPQFSWTQVDGGAITLHTRPQDAAGDGSVRYAIVNHNQSNLASITTGDLVVPFDATSDPYGFFGTFKIGKSLIKNEYYPGGKIDLVWHSGAFKVATVPDPTSAGNDANPSDLHLALGDYGTPYYIVFSRGNLQFNNSYISTGGRWRFAKHQYDFVGGGLGDHNNTYLGNVVLNENDGSSPALSSGSSSGRSDNEQIQNPSTYSGWIDLYGWGTGDNPMKANQENYYYADWNEWGDHPIFNDGTSESSGFWYTLGRDEWQWLLEHRDDATTKVGFATVNGVKGMILLPELLSTYCYDFDGGSGGWDGLISGIGTDQNWGSYWSSTKATKVTNASCFYMRFGQGIVGDHVNLGYYMAPDNGNAVRLVHKVGSSKSLLNFNKKP